MNNLEPLINLEDKSHYYKKLSEIRSKQLNFILHKYNLTTLFQESSDEIKDFYILEEEENQILEKIKNL